MFCRLALEFLRVWKIGGLARGPLRVIAAFLSAGCIVVQLGCHADPPTPSRVAVTVLTVGENAGSGLGTYTASLEPYREITLASQVAGYIGSVKQVMGADGRLRAIQGGDRVKVGELLAAIKSDTYQAKVAQAESALTGAQASYTRAKRDFDRDSELIKQQVIAQATYDQASQEYQSALAQVNQSRAELNQARVTLGFCSLTSAIDGVVLDRRNEAGSLVEPNSPAFTVADTDEMKAVFGVPDIELVPTRVWRQTNRDIEALRELALLRNWKAFRAGFARFPVAGNEVE